MGSADLLRKAARLHQAGRLADARITCALVLRKEPRNVHALRLFGLVRMGQGKPQEAETLIRKALQVNAGSADLHFLLGNALAGQQNYEGAVSAYREALRIEPDHLDANFNLGNALNRLQRFDQAIDSYRNTLRIKSDYAMVHNNLGVALAGLQKFDEAMVYHRRALEIEPTYADALSNLGLALGALGRHDEAIENFCRALLINSRHPDAHAHLGSSLSEQKRYDEAIASFRCALEIRPNRAATHNNLGVALTSQKRFREAIACYRRALELRPDYVDAYNNLALALRGLQKHDEAVACFHRVLQIDPDHVKTLSNLGLVLREQGKCEESVAILRQAIQINPDYVAAHNNLGNALKDLRRYNAALASYQRALEIKPDYADALSNLGSTLAELDRCEEAVGFLRRAVEVDPDHANAYNHLGNTLVRLRQYDQAIASFRTALALQPDAGSALSQLTYLSKLTCSWAQAAELERRLIEHVRSGAGFVIPFGLVLTDATPDDQLRAAHQFVAELKIGSLPTIWGGTPYRHDRIRVAYLSADLHDHATASLIAELVETHDREKFEIFAFSFGPNRPDAMRARLVKAFDHFIDVTYASDFEAARQITQYEIDIAVDLKGFTKDSRAGILAHRPAPVQVNYLGYPGTMGAGFIDYIVVDPFIVPSDQRPFFTEKLVHLPDCYQVNDLKRLVAERTPSRSECGLPEQGFVYCCFNNSFKLTPTVFDAWIRLLKTMPGSVLWLLQENKWAEATLRNEAEARGVAPDRLVFAPRIRAADHLVRHRLADLFLDTLPCNAHTTASDALWMGLPVITCAGQTFAGRVAGSLLRAIGMPDLVASTLEDYEATARALASDPSALAALRTRLAHNRLTTPLFDSARFRRHLEAAYHEMWRISERGEPPRSFAIKPDRPSPEESEVR